MKLLTKIRSVLTSSQLSLFFKENKSLIVTLFSNWGKTRVLLAYFAVVSMCLGLSFIRFSWTVDGPSIQLEFSSISLSAIAFIGVVTIPVVQFFRLSAKSGQTIVPALFEKIYIPVFNKLFNSLDIENYEFWTYNLAVSGNTRIEYDRYNAFDDVILFIEKRVAINEYAHFNKIMHNLKDVISDLSDLLGEHLVDRNGVLYYERFYKRLPYNPNYDSDLEEYKTSVLLIADLTLEMTRILNLLLDDIRRIKPDFLVEVGSLVIKDYGVVKYAHGDNPEYPGLENFKKIVHTRTPHLSNFLTA